MARARAESNRRHEHGIEFRVVTSALVGCARVEIDSDLLLPRARSGNGIQLVHFNGGSC
jgi:hypothetical protein